MPSLFRTVVAFKRDYHISMVRLQSIRKIGPLDGCYANRMESSHLISALSTLPLFIILYLVDVLLRCKRLCRNLRNIVLRLLLRACSVVHRI